MAGSGASGDASGAPRRRYETCFIGGSMNGVGQFARATYRMARRIVISVVGGTLLLLGVILIFTPGPAFVVLPLGLGVLALEFAWARRWLKRVRSMVTREKADDTALASATGDGRASGDGAAADAPVGPRPPETRAPFS